jgi:hypothetical protein
VRPQISGYESINFTPTITAQKRINYCCTYRSRRKDLELNCMKMLETILVVLGILSAVRKYTIVNSRNPQKQLAYHCSSPIYFLPQMQKSPSLSFFNNVLIWECG